MNETEERLNKCLPEILEKLCCGKDGKGDVREYILWLCHYFPEQQKHYNQAHTKASLRKGLTTASKHTNKLAQFLSDPLIRGAIHAQAFRDALAAGEKQPSMDDLCQWDDAARKLARRLESAVNDLGPPAAGDSKKLGGLTSKQWIIVMCGNIFQVYRDDKITSDNNDFLELVNRVWNVVTGEELDLKATVRRVLPEITEWVAGRRGAPIAAARESPANTAKKRSQEHDPTHKALGRVIPLKK